MISICCSLGEKRKEGKTKAIKTEGEDHYQVDQKRQNSLDGGWKYNLEGKGRETRTYIARLGTAKERLNSNDDNITLVSDLCGNP